MIFFFCSVFFRCKSPAWYLSASVFSFCTAESSARARLWVRLNVCVNLFASIKQTSSRWEFVFKISLAGHDWTPKANLISLVVTKELSCRDLEHQSVFESISSKWCNASCIKSDRNKHSLFMFPLGKLWKKKKSEDNGTEQVLFTSHPGFHLNSMSLFDSLECEHKLYCPAPLLLTGILVA